MRRNLEAKKLSNLKEFSIEYYEKAFERQPGQGHQGTKNPISLIPDQNRIPVQYLKLPKKTLSHRTHTSDTSLASAASHTPL
jgi:hypothetical protein